MRGVARGPLAQQTALADQRLQLVAVALGWLGTGFCCGWATVLLKMRERQLEAGETGRPFPKRAGLRALAALLSYFLLLLPMEAYYELALGPRCALPPGAVAPDYAASAAANTWLCARGELAAWREWLLALAPAPLFLALLRLCHNSGGDK